MTHRKLSGLLALFLTGLIVFSGILFPRLMLERQKRQLLSNEGSVTTEDLSVYGNNIVGAKALEARIRLLTELAAGLFSGTSESLTAKTREPLDTELSLDSAINTAYSFLYDINQSCEEYGYSLFGTKPFEADDAEKIHDNTLLYASLDDASLSLWAVTMDNRLVVLDAVSGIPLYVFFNPSEYSVPLLAFSETDMLWSAVSQTYNKQFKRTANLRFSNRAADYNEIGVPFEDDMTVRWAGDSGAYVLQIEAQLTSKGYCYQVKIDLSL